jgi:hypothetical protein
LTIGSGTAFGTSISCAIASAVAVRHLAAFPCGYSRNPSRSALMEVFRSAAAIHVTIGEYSYPSALPSRHLEHESSTMRSHCKGRCAAYDDQGLFRAIFHGRQISPEEVDAGGVPVLA